MDKRQTLAFIVTCAVLCTYNHHCLGDEEGSFDLPRCIKAINTSNINYCDSFKKEYGKCYCEVCFTNIHGNRWNATVNCSDNKIFHHNCSKMTMLPSDFCSSEETSSDGTSTTSPRSTKIQTTPMNSTLASGNSKGYRACSEIKKEHESSGCDVCFIEHKMKKQKWKVNNTCETRKRSCFWNSSLSELNLCTKTKPSTTTSGKQLDLNSAIVAVVAVFAVAVIVIVLVVFRRRKSGNRIPNEENALVAEGGPAIPLVTLSNTSSGSEYAEIPADAIGASSANGNPYSKVDMSALDHHEYGQLKRETNNDYSLLSSVSKPERTDNTYSHITISSEASKTKQEPLDDSEEDYNKLHGMLINKAQDKKENKHSKDKEYDPDYSHLEHWKSNTKYQRNHADHVDQSIKEDGETTGATISTESACAAENVDKKNDEQNEDGVVVNVSTTATPVTFALRQENENAAETAKGSERHYFIVEKHEREADLELPEEIPSDHDYFFLEKQNEAQL